MRILTLFAAVLLPLGLSACAAPTPRLQSAQVVPAPAPAPAPLSQLAASVDIPYESFTLENGLTTLVHTDRKAPIVGVTVYYRVGSKNEPRGRTGFAHLFEHLMFGGSENVPNFDVPPEAAGSTSTNGSTWYDRTNYVETVPTGALDLALFMESDRMGHLLGAVNQDKLDKQRGVVQNEKRQGDNQPYGLVEYQLASGLLPIGHPYRHTTIGSMADLDAASLADVRGWFTDHYGPNNVVLALTGDIDVATARAAVTRWFGDIPRGAEVMPVAAAPVTLNQDVREVMTDQVPVERLYRYWTGPALTDPDAVPLAMGLAVLGGLESSRLDNALVRGEELAVSVYAGAEQHEQLSFLNAQMDITPGADPAAAEAVFNAEIARLITDGPTADELARAATQTVSARISGLQSVGGFFGKGATLAEGLLFAGDPAYYKTELARTASLTPAQVQAAMERWLTRPSYTLTVVPGERSEDGALLGGWGDEATRPAPAPDAKARVAPIRTGPPREAPPVAPVGPLSFPQVERAALSNGMVVELARRTAVPQISMAITFDAGYAADGPGQAGKQSLMMAALTEGTTSRSALDIAVEQERLGASIAAGADVDSSVLTMTALTANLAPSLDLLADIARHPAFEAEAVERVKAQRLAEIAQELATPGAVAARAFDPLLYGDQHPYGASDGTGKASVIAAQDRTTMAAEHDRWLRPDLARITVVGDVTMAQLLPALEQAFGNWRNPETPAPTKDLAVPTPPARPRLVVIDRPNSPQSVLLIGRLLPVRGTDRGMEALGLANEVVGDGFLSRLNLDLREDKGWTYGIRSSIRARMGQEALQIYTPVQADRTADSIRLILSQLAAFPAAKPVDAAELQRVTEGNVANLPNRYETNGQVLGALLGNQLLHRPDNYQASLPAIYRAVDAAAINQAAREYLQPDDLLIVVVGDRKAIDQQLAGLDMPVEYMAAAGL